MRGPPLGCWAAAGPAPISTAATATARPPKKGAKGPDKREKYMGILRPRRPGPRTVFGPPVHRRGLVRRVRLEVNGVTAHAPYRRGNGPQPGETHPVQVQIPKYTG